ncbi:MAG: DUF6089 family protein [Saprospiraceae bacterium]|nr:DUF6089 family protein [Saprospiraceae bacterium]
MRIIPTIYLVLVSCVLGQAQKGYEVGLWLGGAHYFGDLNTTYRLDRPGLAAGLIGRYNFNNRLSFKMTAGYGRLEARDADSDNPFQKARNLSFRSHVIDGTFQIEFNFLPYVHGSDDQFFTPYLSGGLGVYHYNPKTLYQGNWEPLQPLGTEGQPIGGEYTLVQPSLVYAFGLKVDVNYHWSINVEVSGRALFSDYLDDVSTVYPNLIELEAQRGPLSAALADRSGEVVAEPIGEAGRQRGNSRNNDSFGFLTVGIVYYVGTLQCPPMSRPERQ